MFQILGSRAPELAAVPPRVCTCHAWMKACCRALALVAARRRPPFWPSSMRTRPAPARPPRRSATAPGSATRRRQTPVLYFGQSPPFWSAMRGRRGRPPPATSRSTKAPSRSAASTCAAKSWLRSRSTLAGAESRSAGGPWDVLAAARRLASTSPTYFERSGRMGLRERRGRDSGFREAGTGLNEWAHGPGGRPLVSRYGSARRARATASS